MLQDWAECNREISFKEALNKAKIEVELDGKRPFAGIDGARNLAKLVEVLTKENVRLTITTYFNRKRGVGSSRANTSNTSI